MQAKILSLSVKERFSGLDEDSRRDVLQEPLQEIVRMIEQNLLAKFKKGLGILQMPDKMQRRSLRESDVAL